MHGIPDLYKSPYSVADLRKTVKTIETSAGIKKAFVYFNNDIGGSAITNAKQMTQIIMQKRKRALN
jgi:uncharacterized protein YecE (DUF72 family)